MGTINKKTRGSAGLLTALCMLAFCGGLQVEAANAEGAGVSSAAHPARASGNSTAASAKRKAAKASYFIEFRSRTARSYGHTYVVHGKVSGRAHVLGLHAIDPGSSTFIRAHFAPVPGEASASIGDGDERFVTARYRIEMSGIQYRRIAAYIGQLKAAKHSWQLTGYNCNAFAGDIARFMGMRTPSPLELPRSYISHLRAMNSAS
jgi:hypothetical protein